MRELLFPPEQDPPFGTFPLRATARSVMDVLSCAVRAYPAYAAGDHDPAAVTAQSVRDLRADQFANLRDFLRAAKIGTLTTESKAGKAQDSIRLLPDGSELPDLCRVWADGDPDGLVRWLAPLLRVDPEAPLGDQGRMLAGMLGRRVDYTLAGSHHAGNANPEVAEVAEVLRERAAGGHLPAKKRTGRLSAREAHVALASTLNVSPFRARARLAALLRAGLLPGLAGDEEAQPPKGVAAMQKVVGLLPDGGWGPARYDLDFIGGFAGIRLAAGPR